MNTIKLHQLGFNSQLIIFSESLWNFTEKMEIGFGLKWLSEWKNLK